MKKSKLGKVLFAAVIFSFCGSGVATVYAQGDGDGDDQSVTAAVGVTINLADKLAIMKTSDLNFGGVFLNKTQDVTVTMDKAGAITAPGTLLYNTDDGTIGGFKVMADVAFPYSLDFPTTLALMSGVNSLTFTPSVFDAAGTAVTPSTTTRVNIGATGTDQYTVVGNVLVPMGSKTGTYAADFILTAIWD